MSYVDEYRTMLDVPTDEQIWMEFISTQQVTRSDQYITYSDELNLGVDSYEVRENDCAA